MGPFGKKKPIEEMNAKEVEKEAKKLFDKNKWDEAEVYLRRLVELRPDYTPAYSTLSTCLFYLDKKDEAVELIHRALEIEPNKPDLLVTCGLLVSSMDGRLVEGITLLEKAKSLGYNNAKVLAVLDAMKKKAWIHYPPTTGDNILVISKTIDPDALKPIEDPELDKVLEAKGISKEGNVAVNITPTLNFIAEIAKEAMAAGKVVSMRDLCVRSGVISDQKGTDVVSMAGQMHGFTATYQLLENDDMLATFKPKE